MIIIIHPFNLLSFYKVSIPHCQQSQSRLSNLSSSLPISSWLMAVLLSYMFHPSVGKPKSC